MKADLLLLKAFLKYDIWEKYHEEVSEKDIDEDLKYLYRILNNYHLINEEKKDLHVIDLQALYFASNPRNKDFYEDVFETLDTYEPNLHVVDTYVQQLRNNRLFRELSITAYEVSEGKKTQDSLFSLLHAIQKPDETSAKEEVFVTTSLEEIYSKLEEDTGLTFRLSVLAEALGRLRKSHFGFVFARPETGKTTFLASEVTFMLEQIKEGEYIHWYNNEQAGEEVMLRVYQAFFGIELEKLLANVSKYETEFKEKVGNKLLLLDSANIHKNTVERLCKKYPPALIVFDQIDKIQGFDTDRNDLQLGAIYIWARELAKQYCPVIGVCQADGTGENVKWLTMGHVSNAKTAKQAEADWILGIGKIHDTGFEELRFLHLSKNKLNGPNKKLRHMKKECLIKPDIARYMDLK